ncbi:MAG: membrane dipeptidase [Myxococcota bacterium]
MTARRRVIGLPLWLALALAPPAHATIVRPGGAEVPDNLWPTLDTISSVAAARYEALENDPLPIDFGDVDGFADLHVHQFSNLGFDQRVVWDAADSCRDWGVLDPIPESKHGVFLNANVVNLALTTANKDPLKYSLVDLFDHPFRTRGTDDDPDRSNEDWPVWYTWAHQQHAIDKLAQAHADGLNLMVMSAVSNRVMCLISDTDTGPGNCADNLNIEPQLIAAWQLSEDLDLLGDGVRDRDAWYQPVVSPGDANHVMAEGRLAVVLTVEGDEVFDRPSRGGWVGDSSDAELAEIVNYYGLLGVRIFQPVHEFDNLTGAAAHVDDAITYVHPLLDELPLNGGLFSALDGVACVGIIDCALEYFTGELDLTGLMDGAQALGTTEDGTPANLNGITPYGERLVDLLESENLVIDLAHMSRRMQRAVIARTDPSEPLLMSHTSYELARSGSSFSEFSTADDVAIELAARGGMVGVRTLDSFANTFELNGAPVVENDCSGSSRSFAQHLLFGELQYGLAQGLASDFNGATTQVRPRFHDPADPRWNEQDWACRGREDQQALQGTRDANGTDTDFDLIGLGHIGLEGALIQDLRNIGFDPVSLDGSARAFGEMWAEVGTYVPDFPPEERLPRFEPSPGLDRKVVLEALCSVMDCSSGSTEIPELPDLDWIDILVDYNQRGTGYDPFPSGEGRDEAVIAAIEGALGTDLVWDERVGWVNTGVDLGGYVALNDDFSLNLDQDPYSRDTNRTWPGLFNKDATFDFDLDPSTADQPVDTWDGSFNLDGSIDLDRAPSTIDTALTRDILTGGK